MATVLVSQIVLGIGASLIVAWFSRHREFRADAGSAKLLGSALPMQRALARLGGIEPATLPESMAALGINDKPGFMALFSSHPPIEQRIAALRNPQVTAL
jgi:heat shock protein HtpX